MIKKAWFDDYKLKDKAQKYKVKFLGRLPNVTKSYRSDYVESYKRFIVSYFDSSKFKNIKLVVRTIFNKMGDEYSMITIELGSWRRGTSKYFIIDTDGTIEYAPEYFLKSFDDHLNLFPRSN